MPPRRNDRGKKEGHDHAKAKAVQRANSNPCPRETNRLSAFIFVLVFVAVGILFTIAVANWQKTNLWAGLWWGVGGFLLFGIGAAFAYYYYVIKPAEAFPPSTISNPRPYVVFKIARLRELSAGSYPVIEFDLQNIGATEASVTIRNSTCQFVQDLKPPNLQYQIGTSMFRTTVAPTQIVTGRVNFNPLILTDDMIKELNDDRARLYFYARGEYVDTPSGRKYPLPFCYVYNREMASHLIFCDEGVTFKEPGEGDK